MHWSLLDVSSDNEVVQLFDRFRSCFVLGPLFGVFSPSESIMKRTPMEKTAEAIDILKHSDVA